MRLDVRHRLKPPSSPADILARHAWKVGLGVIVAALLTTRGVTEAPVHLSQRSLAAGGGPTLVACGALPAGTTTWNTAGSPYILPLNTTNDPIPNDPNACPAFPAAGQPQPATPPGVVVLPGSTLVIDAGQGPVQIFSHGSGITVDGGELRTINTSAIPGNFVSFDAEPDVASWDGISIIASDSSHRGNGSLSYTSIAHALTSIAITSGAVATDDPLVSGAQVAYGLALANVAIGPSYFDGIDATDTPISFVGQADAGGLATGLYGTVNNIGSQGIKVGFDSSAPSIPAKALQIKAVTFGSSVPFGETSCLPLQACAAGSIGNDAIQGLFTTGQQQPIELSGNRFFRAGSYGLELTNPNNPTIVNNIFTCNGSGSAKPVITCVGSGLRYSAIYLNGVTNLNVGASGLNNNKGQQNGLDAVVLNGQVVADLPWQTPWNDPNLPTVPPSPPNPPHALGYMVANGDLQLVNSKLTLIDGDVVKVKGGAILITNGRLEASSPLLKTFTSLRDNTVGIQACPSVFVQSCPSPLPANEWTGIGLVGSTANIANANILFPTKAIDISGGQASLIGPDGGSYGLVVTKSQLGPTFSDSVAVNATPVYISASKFCRIDTIASDATYLQCIGAGPGDHGINASYTGTPRPPAGGGLKLIGNDFQGSTNEAILGTAVGGRVVDIENNTVEGAGTYGMHLVSADNLILKGNGVTGSGIGNQANTTTYAAIYLDGISKADFSGPISGNSGSGNGLDAIAFHGSTADTKPLNWKTVGATGGALGYIVDGDLAVNGDLTLNPGDYAPVLGGAITVHTGTFSSTGAALSSLKEQAPHLPSCGSVFVPKISGVCPAAAPGDWKGLVLDPSKKNQLTDSEVRYAVTGISVGPPSVPPVTLNLTMIRSNVRNTTSDGVATQSPVSITDGAFTGNAGRGIKVDLTAVSPSSTQQLAITGHTSISGSGQDGIQAIALSGHGVTITGVKVDGAGAFGINLSDASNLTLTDNTVTNSAATYPAIYINRFNGAFGTIHGNKGASNGIDAIAFNGTVTDSLIWQTARKTTDPTQPLGYVLDNTLNMQSGNTLTVNSGDIVKVGNGGVLNLSGAALRADDILSSTQKIFTSLTDNSAGVVACPSVVQSGCGTGVTAAPGDWAGISLSGSTAKGTVVNASVRYAGTGISISNGATSTYGSSSFGLVVSQSTVASTKTDGVSATNTPVSVTDSIISGGVHGANVTLTNTSATSASLRLSGNRFTSQTAEAILGQGLFGQPVWITDNRVQNAGTFGIRLLNSNNLVLRNNNVIGSGGGPGAGAGRYPAIYLPNVSADFAGNVRGNVGSGNGLDSIAFDGTVTSNLTWLTPSTNLTTGQLGYLLDGGLTLDGTTLTVNPDGVVKSLGGPITINGGSLDAAGTLGHEATFTSLRDNASGTVANAVSCPSVFVSASDCAQPQAGNWGGIAITDKEGQRGNNTIDYSVIEYAITGISIDSGPVSTALPNLKVTNSKVLHTSLEGISASDTPIDIEGSTIGDQATPAGAPADIRAHGIIASFFSPANCPSPAGCIRLTLMGNHIYSTGKDGIVANGLGGQPTVVTDNTVTDAGTYGIRLVGADQLTATTNHVRKSTPPAASSLLYPAIYLSSVKADFENSAGSGAIVEGNDGKWTGMDAVVLHGEATKTLTWITATAAPSGPLPVADVKFGYLLDGSLTVDGDFVTNGDIVKTLNGGIKINGGSLQSTATLFTSLKDSAGMSACQSVFIPTCPSSPAAGDWNGINIDAADSMFNGSMLLYASSGITINSASLKVNNSVIRGLSGYAVTTTRTGSAQIDCASIYGNSGGVFSKGAATTSVNNSNLYSNSSATTRDLDATVATTASGDWWNPTTPPNPDAGQYNATYVTVTSPLPQERPTLNAGSGSVAVTSNNTNANGNLGKGTLTVTLTFDRKMNVHVQPVVTFLGPGETVAHVVTGSWNGDSTSWTGTAAVDPTLNSAGLNRLTVTKGTSCVPDGLNVMNSETATFTLDFSTATVTGVGSAQSVGARSATFNESVNPNGWSAQKDTYVFFQYRLDSGGSYDASVIAGIQAGTLDPTGLLGYQVIGHGTAAVPVSAQVSQLLSPATNYDYRAVAVDLNGITTGTDHLFATLAAADHLVVTGAASIKAGDPYAVTVTAKNPASQTVIDYAGTVSFSSSDLQFVAPSPGTLTNGTATFTATLKTAGSQSITAGDGVITGQLTPISVNSADAQTLTVAAPATATAGISFTVTVTAKDPFNNTATGYIGTVQFTSTDGQALLPGNYTFLAGDNGTHGGLSVTLKTAGSNTVTATDTVTSSITGGQPVSVSPSTATVLQMSGLSGGTAGLAQTATVTARDAYNNVATAYAGTIHFASTDSQAIVPVDYTFGGADNGVHVFTAGVTLKTAATQSVTVTDTVTSSLTATQNGLVIIPAAAATLQLTYAGPVTHMVAFNLTVTALDAYGNTATGYLGTVHFTSTDPAPTLPADYTFLAGDSGVHAFSVTLSAAGSPTVTATDTASAGITGTVTVTVS